jgi:hypothetical protein
MQGYSARVLHCMCALHMRTACAPHVHVHVHGMCALHVHGMCTACACSTRSSPLCTNCSRRRKRAAGRPLAAPTVASSAVPTLTSGGGVLGVGAAGLGNRCSRTCSAHSAGACARTVYDYAPCM